MGGGGRGREFNFHKIGKKKPWPDGPELHPSFDASSPLPAGCCPQSHEILLNKGMKYWKLGMKCIRLSRTFITTVHKAAAVIG
jgi:hypothetical protein